MDNAGAFGFVLTMAVIGFAGITVAMLAVLLQVLSDARRNGFIPGYVASVAILAVIVVWYLGFGMAVMKSMQSIRGADITAKETQ